MKISLHMEIRHGNTDLKKRRPKRRQQLPYCISAAYPIQGIGENRGSAAQ